MAHEDGYGSSPHMRIVAWSILAMGVSLAVVILLYIGFGWEPGSNFSDRVMKAQQEELRDRSGLPPAQELTPQEALIPPSLRDLN